MAHVVIPLDRPSGYTDMKTKSYGPDKAALLAKSSTIYVGNLSFYTTEEQIYELFSKCTSPEKGGGIFRIIMGLDREEKLPCGFCFVEFYMREDALACIRYISGTKLDERIIRCDLDVGWVEGRQYGRGRGGGQVRDDYREDYDSGRGGWGGGAYEVQQRRKEYEAAYQDEPYGDRGGFGRDEGAWTATDTKKSLKRAREDDPAEDLRRPHPNLRAREESPRTNGRPLPTAYSADGGTATGGVTDSRKRKREDDPADDHPRPNPRFRAEREED